MKVYQYDEKNYYTGFLILDSSDKSPSGAWNIPARCVEIAPPAEKEGYKRKWSGSGWEYEEIPKEPEPPEPTLAELKSLKLAEVDAWTAHKIIGGFVSSCSGAPVRYDSDKDTQLTMQGIALNVHSEQFAAEYPQGCPVRGYADGAETKSVHMLSAEQVLNWCADLSAHIGACKQAGWEKQALVETAESKEALEAIILD